MGFRELDGVQSQPSRPRTLLNLVPGAAGRSADVQGLWLPPGLLLPTQSQARASRSQTERTPRASAAVKHVFHRPRPLRPRLPSKGLFLLACAVGVPRAPRLSGGRTVCCSEALAHPLLPRAPGTGSLAPRGARETQLLSAHFRTPMGNSRPNYSVVLGLGETDAMERSLCDRSCSS